MPEFDGIKPKRDYQGLQFVMRKRYSDNWQALASFLYSNSTGFGRRTLRQDINVEGPMFWDDNWMSSLNQTINNLDGPLPFTPKYEFKLSGSYHGPQSGGRYWWPAADGVGTTVVASRDLPSAHAVRWSGGRHCRAGRLQSWPCPARAPATCPRKRLFDLHLEKAFKFNNAQRVQLIVDGFNLFNTFTPTDADPHFEYGKVTAIPSPRRFRFGARFEF